MNLAVVVDVICDRDIWVISLSVLAPFHHISEHVEQPEVVWTQSANTLCAVLAVHLSVADCPCVFIQQQIRLAEISFRLCSGATRVFPLSLGG